MIQRRELFMRCWISVFVLSAATGEQQGRTSLVKCVHHGAQRNE